MLKKIARISWLTTGLIFIAGVALVSLKVIDFGISLFVIFPVAIGFSTAITSENAKSISIQLIQVTIGLTVFLILASVVGLEGVVCILLAFPILTFLLLVGFALAVFLRATVLKKYVEQEGNMYVLFMPLVLLLAGNFIETLFTDEPRLNTITTGAFLPYQASLVFDRVKSMDSLEAEKPWLLQLGLPAPYKCVLEADTIGAKRICLFENGEIVAEITAYDPGELLSMKVIDYNLSGQRWFSFKDAHYTFDAVEGGTKILRVTSYTSLLKPRFYWAPLERYAIGQEHMFVLRSLRKNLEDSLLNVQ